MYAVVVDRTRQIRVEQGQKVLLDHNDAWTPGSEVVLDQVCILGGDGEPKVGAPWISGAKVVLEVVGPERGPKVVVGKFRRRKNYRRKTGFRAKYVQAVVKSIEG